MKLYKKPGSPYWWIDMNVNGKRVRKSTGRLHSDRKSAQRVMAQEYENMMNVRQFKDKPEITLDEAFEITLSEVEGQTLRVYKAAREALRGTLGGKVLLSGITTADLDRHASARRKSGCKTNTIRGDFKALKRTINRVRGQYQVNTDLEWPKVKKFTKTRYLSEDEEVEVLKRLLDASDDQITAEKAYVLAVFLLDTGMRLSEATSIEWSSIDMTGRTIEVYRSKTASLSVVPISDRLHVLLKRYGNQSRPFLKMAWAVPYLRRVISDVCNQNARVVETRGTATIHSLRDTFATRMLKRGMSIYKLSKLLGHTTSTMSEKYVHLEGQDVVEEARSIMNQ